MPGKMKTEFELRRANLPLGDLLVGVRDFARLAPTDGAATEGAVDAPAAEVTLVFTAGASVKRYDWDNYRYYLEQLVVDESSVDLSRLERGAPLLDSHMGYELENVIGRVDQPKISGGQGTCRAVFSRREEIAGIVQDVADGIIRNVSVGYTRDIVEMVAPATDSAMWLYRVVRWTPCEVSLVPIPADMDCQVVRSADGTPKFKGHDVRMFACEVRSVSSPSAAAAGSLPLTKEHFMTEEEIRAAAELQARNANEDKEAAVALAARNAAAAEQTRITAIQTRSRAAGLPEEFAQRLVTENVSAEAASANILDELTARAEKAPTRAPARVEITRDENETRRTQMQNALHLRANPRFKFSADAAEQAEALDLAREFRGMSLLDMARDSIAFAGGKSRTLTRREVAQAAMGIGEYAVRGGAHGTSDFTEVMASTVNRSLRQAYQLAPRTFTAWARASTAPDFRQVARTQLSELSKMQQVTEGGEYKFATFSDSAEKYSLSKYGTIIAITWESIINDDLSAFSRIPTLIGEEVAALESDIVYGVLTANAALADSVALFHATHNNLAGVNAAISVASLALGRAAIRKQVGPGKDARPLNLESAYLICGPDKELEAVQFTSVNYVAATSATINPSFNTSLTPVIDARLTGNQWYLSADPARIDTIEYMYLEGEEGVFTEQRQGFEVDGLQVKARHAFAAKAIDFRGMYKNVGA